MTRFLFLSLALLSSLVLAVALALVPLGAPTPGKAAFPGANGKIAFVSGGDIYLIDPDGTHLSNITNTPQDEESSAKWSPDGTRIAFVAFDGSKSQIYVMNADGTARQKVTSDPEGARDPGWSPDGSKIAFYSMRDPYYHIFLTNANGTGETKLTDTSNYDSGAAWSPDGSRIAFVRLGPDNGYTGHIYAMNSTGGGESQLTHGQGESSPAWSPDGSKIAFAARNDDPPGNGLANYEIYVMSSDGTSLTRLTTDPAVDNSPAWSPDGSSIAFLSNRVGLYSIGVYSMNADGSGQTKLAGGSTFGGLDWQPKPAASPSSTPSPTPAPTPSPTPTTVLTQGVPAGATQLLVAGSQGFGVRNLVTINPGGPNEETNVIAAFGSVHLAAPLLLGHALGELIVTDGRSIAPGDANCDGQANAVDALFVLRRVANLLPLSQCWAAGNVRCLDDIDAVDALSILRVVAALAANLPPGCPPIGTQ